MGILIAVVIGTTTGPLLVYLSLSSYSVVCCYGYTVFFTAGAKKSEAKKPDAKRIHEHRGAHAHNYLSLGETVMVSVCSLNQTFIDLALFVSGSYVQIQAVARSRQKSTG